MTLDDALAEVPILAVLRGISPDEAEGVGKALFDAAIPVMEVPLNSPDPFRSIRMQADLYGSRSIVGAGTVLHAEDVARVADAGGTIIVSPNFNEQVVRATKRCGLLSCPGVFTPSEAFNALDAGADMLKLFPGDGMSPKVVKALRAVLPKGVRLVVTGGVDVGNIPDWLAGGADGVGIGSSLYRPGKSVADVAVDAMKFADAARKAKGAPAPAARVPVTDLAS